MLVILFTFCLKKSTLTFASHSKLPDFLYKKKTRHRQTLFLFRTECPRAHPHNSLIKLPLSHRGSQSGEQKISFQFKIDRAD